ncbi:MAG: hypothetical protein KA807_10055 [Prolixibacteraceae bacterium]|nr:hypothetical protein [Prolixibacteraceae bacterium]
MLLNDSEVKEIVARNQEVIEAMKEFNKKIEKVETSKKVYIDKKITGEKEGKFDTL